MRVVLFPLQVSVVLREYDTERRNVTIEVPRESARGSWSGKMEFFLASVSYAVGLGNIWRFPYLCHKNGGGAFLLPYAVMLLLVGLPLFFLEFAIGQFASLGPISVWNISPLFKGIGYAMVVTSWMISIFYNIIIAQGIFYLFAGFQADLPWVHCGNAWNNNFTCTTNRILSNMTSHMQMNATSPSEDFYMRYVLDQSGSIDEFGLPSWRLLLCLLLAWILCILALIKGIQSIGGIAYFTTAFPYLILTILLVRGLLLPGAIEGIKYYLTPNFSKLKDVRVWMDAATQIFFSLGCCSGGLIAISSYNKFKNNCCRDAVIVACINCATSIYAGFVVFSVLGFMAHVKNVKVQDVTKSGPGLAFIVYPEAIAEMPMPPIWSFLFFLMLCTLGLGSQFPTVETVISGILDEVRPFNYMRSPIKQTIFRVIFCLCNFLLGIPMICRGGYYLQFLVDWSLSGYPLLLIAFAELLVICYAYGLSQFCRDIELMTNERPNIYWRIAWKFITPVVIATLIILSLIYGERLILDDYQYPQWAVHLANMIAAFPIVFIPSFFLYKFCTEGGCILYKELLKPVQEWGPVDGEHRAEFITRINSRYLTKFNDSPERLCNGEFVGLPAILSANAILLVSNILLLAPNEAGIFFQSKLSVVEKLVQKHTKEATKRTNSLGGISLNPLTASQCALATLTSTINTEPDLVTMSMDSKA